MIDFQKLNDILINNQSFILTTHVNPDADAIGSEIALLKILNLLGKKVRIINYSLTPYNMSFLDASNKIEKYNDSIHNMLFDEADVLAALDFNRSDRLVSMEKIFTSSKKLKICIDHHQNPMDFVDHQFIDQSYSATGQILYELIRKTDIVEMNNEIACPIYAAIMTDTGSFRFERTNPDLHRITAELLEHNVNPQEVYDKLYDRSKLSKIKLLGKTLDSIQLLSKGRLGYAIVTQEMFRELDAIESDTENFVNYTLSIENVNLGLLFIELKNGFKVSFRSKGNLPANKLAEEFDGGGHLNAAGARLRNSDMNEMIPKILKKAENYLEKYS